MPAPQPTPPRRRLAAGAVLLAALAAAGVSLHPTARPRAPRSPQAQDSAAPRGSLPPAALEVPASATALPALDCARPEARAARIDDVGVSSGRLCARLTQLGEGSGRAERARARAVLDQMIDAALVRRALERERQSVSEPELEAALAGLGPSATPLLREQVRERVEQRKLAGLRAHLDVTDAEVDLELALGAPGIDRGQGVRVEAWIARTAPGADEDSSARSRAAAAAFADGVSTQPPEALSARHHLTRVEPFVLGSNGVEPALEAAARDLSDGEFSGAVRTRVGWAVLRALHRVEGAEAPTGPLRAQVREALERRRLQAARQDLLAALRSEARVEVLVDL